MFCLWGLPKNRCVIQWLREKIAYWATYAKGIQRNWTDEEDDCKVHRGFNAALKSVWTDVVAEIRRLRTNNQTIWVTDHSLGGALATLAAARLQLEDKIPVSGLYTFFSLVLAVFVSSITMTC